MTCIYCNDDPVVRINCYCRDATGMERERDLLLHLDVLQREYKERARPIVDEIAKIRAMRPGPALVVQICPHCGNHYAVGGKCWNCAEKTK